MFAVAEGQAATVKVLLSGGAAVNVKSKRSEGCPMENLTPLMVAAGEGHPGIVQALLARGAEVNVRTTDGRTALMFAAAKGHLGVVKCSCPVVPG